MMLAESDIGAIPLLGSFRSRKAVSIAEAGLVLCHLDRDLGTVALGEPGLVFQSGRHGTVADFVRVAELVEIEQFGGQLFAARVALTFVLVDADFQLSSHRSVSLL